MNFLILNKIKSKYLNKYLDLIWLKTYFLK